MWCVPTVRSLECIHCPDVFLRETKTKWEYMQLFSRHAGILEVYKHPLINNTTCQFFLD